MSLFETFTKGQMDAQEALNRNFALAQTQLGQKVDATPMQWLRMIDCMNEGYVIAGHGWRCEYGKDSYGRVHLQLGVQAATGKFTEVGMSLATLPAGYRPDRSRMLVGCAWEVGHSPETFHPCPVEISPSGLIKAFYMSSLPCDILVAQDCFIAY